MPSRFFKHHSYVLSSPTLIRYSWIHFSAWFSCSQFNCFWCDNHPPLIRTIFSGPSSPQVLHYSLTSPSAILSSSGYTNSSALSLPLNLPLQPGLTIFSSPIYSGQSSFIALPTKLTGNPTMPVAAQSLTLSSAVWAATNSSNNNHFIVLESIPDIIQLPTSNLGSLSLTELQSSAYSPICASSGVCTTAGTCKCASGFIGTSCESCAPGFFGSKPSVNPVRQITQPVMVL